jgi:hypothetical protein
VLTFRGDMTPKRSPMACARADVGTHRRALNHKMYRPNDPLYSNQWNFPDRHGARADLRPARPRASVAVLDSGVAFKTATFRYNSRFRSA